MTGGRHRALPVMAWVLGLALLGGLGCGRSSENASWVVRVRFPAGVDPEQVFHHNNLGVAHLEQHHYQEALNEFDRVVNLVPGWAEGQVNCGIAAASLHDSTKATDRFQKAIRISPTHPYAHYGLGLVLKQEGKSAEAMAEFRKVLETDARDSDSYYNLGLLYAREGKHAEAVDALRRTLSLQPANLSARFRLASSLLALGRKEEGDREMADFRRMSGTGSGLSMGLQYSEQGKYSMALTDYRAFGIERAKPAAPGIRWEAVPPGESGIAFRHAGDGRDPRPPGADGSGGSPACSYGPGLAASDYDGDGDMDVLVTGCSPAGDGASALLRNDGEGHFADATMAAGLSEAKNRIGAAFGDYDNDGRPDLYLTGESGNLLFHNEGDGRFRDVTADARAGGSGLGLGAAWGDADHDGDLDLVVARRGPDPLLFFNNDGNGKFHEAAREKRVDRPLTAIAPSFSDFDDDRDIDLLISTAAGPIAWFSNDRIGTFTDLTGKSGLPADGTGEGATLADLDGDGWTDVYLPRSGWYQNLEGTGFRRRSEIPAVPGALGSAALDFDNDGDLDLAVVGRKLVLFQNDGGGRFRDVTSDTGLGTVPEGVYRSVVAADFDSDGDPDLLIGVNGGGPLLLRNEGGNLNSWLKLKLSGLHSNKLGVGTKVEVHAGADFQRREVRLGEGYLSQSPETLLFGLGRRDQVDFVRLLWPGGVLQSELEVSARRTLDLSELDRKGSSCPLLFGWDGRTYRFITDFLGVGGLGFLIRPGVYGAPDPDEYLKIEADQLKPRDGYLLVQVLENLEEVSYLDQAELWVLDHPPEITVSPNERFGGSGPPPYELFATRKPIFPESARDDQDRNVLAEILKVDRTYPDRFPLEERLPGYAETHTLNLDFGDALNGKKNLVLFLYGWVDYGYSSTNLAASQAGISPLSPRLETVGPGGEWETVVEDIGYPAGLPRMMTVDLRDHAPFTDGRFRITTNLRVYWDQIYFAQVEKDSGVKTTKLPAVYADLHSRGYPREHSPDGRKPLIYDYNLMDRTFPFRNLAGSYTRFGVVTELLSATDDRFVILGRGEEITLKFKATTLPKLPPKWKRDYLLYANGYCKDMDPNTAFPDTVEPLPFHGMSGYPYSEEEHYPDDPAHQEYQKKFNTRKVSGRP